MRPLLALVMVFFLMAATSVARQAGARNSGGGSEVTFFVHGLMKTASGAT